MRRFLIVMFFTYLSMFFSSPTSFAENSCLDTVEKAMPKQAREICGRISDDGSYDTRGAFLRFLDRAEESIETAIRSELNTGTGMIVIGLSVSLSAALVSSPRIVTYLNSAGICAMAALLLDGVDSITDSIVSTLNMLSDYSRAAIPAVFTAAAAGGAVVSAPAKYAAVCMALDVLMNLSVNFVLPLIYAFIALSLSSGLYANPLVKCCKRVVKWCVVTSMTVLTLAFTAFIGVTGIITGSADALAVKTARTVISGALPVVGGIISDAASAVLSAAALVKNSAGTLSMLAVCAVCIEAFAKLLVKSLIFKAGAAVCETVPGVTLSDFIADVGTAVDMLIGLVGCTCIILFVSLASAIRTVSA